MTDFFPVYIYFGMILAITLVMLAISGLFPSDKSAPAKFAPYESGIETKTNLFKKRFALHHYLVGLIFLVFDIEVIFMYPWAVVGKQIGTFAFYEMLFFMAALIIGFIYVWRKGGLEWE